MATLEKARQATGAASPGLASDMEVIAADGGRVRGLHQIGCSESGVCVDQLILVDPGRQISITVIVSR